MQLLKKSDPSKDIASLLQFASDNYRKQIEFKAETLLNTDYCRNAILKKQMIMVTIPVRLLMKMFLILMTQWIYF